MGLKTHAIKALLVSFILFSSIFTISVPAQQKTNLEIFYNLVDSSVVKINQEISTTGLKINFTTGSYFSVFQNQIVSDFAKLGRTIVTDSTKRLTNLTIINYTIDNANVKYGEMERDGFFGDFIMPRKINLSGSYSLSEDIISAEKFDLAYEDTVAVDRVKVFENPSYPFTQGEIPSEPFLSSLFEPIVAISSAALAVILFFTVRSK